MKASEQPLSTFSADVDTASYTYFRKLVNNGYTLEHIMEMGNSRSIRTEEMVNYFDYSLPTPDEGELFGHSVTFSPAPWNSEHVLMVLGLQAAKPEVKQKNNLVFLIDVSGSMMSDDKLPLLKKSFSYLIDQLSGDDIISIVTYSGREAVVLDSCEGTKKEIILDAVDSLTAQGSTNGQAGLQKAYELAKKNYISDGNNRIIMASDGDLNVGISSEAELKSYISQKRDEGVFLSVLGFGTGNFKDASMSALAQNGNGVYHYIDSEAEAERIFTDGLLSTLYTVAKDVKLQLMFDPVYVSEYRLIGYENRLLNNEDFNDDSKDAGELGAGHSVTVCYELVLTAEADVSEGAEDKEWMKLSVRYKEPKANESKLEEYRLGSASYTDAPSDDFKFICAVVQTSLLIRSSRYIGEDVTLQSIIAQLEELQGLDVYKTEFLTLLKKLA